MKCMVCEKQKNFKLFTGDPIANIGGMVVSHFPIIEQEKAIKGHLLIESRRHVADVAELSDDEAQALGLLICKCIKLLTKEFGAEHAYAFRINDKVSHFHFHIVPRFPGTPREFWGHKITEWPDATKLNLEEVHTLSQELHRCWKS
jgi:histidine triad (HIT) family protein